MTSDTPLYDAAAWAAGFAPIDRPLGAVRVLKHEPICHRCTKNGTPGFYCPPCENEREVQANRDDARDELTVTVFTAHTAALRDYPADIRFPGGAA